MRKLLQQYTVFKYPFRIKTQLVCDFVLFFYLSSALSVVLDELPSSSWVHNYTTWVSHGCLCSLVGSPWCLTGSGSIAGSAVHKHSSSWGPRVSCKRVGCRAPVVCGHRCPVHMNPCVDKFMLVFDVMLLLFFFVLAADWLLVWRLKHASGCN